MRKRDKRRARYLPVSEGITESVEYRRFPMMNTTAADRPSGLIAPILLCQYPNIGEKITWARGLTATIVLYFHSISSSEFPGSNLEARI